MAAAGVLSGVLLFLIGAIVRVLEGEVSPGLFAVLIVVPILLLVAMDAVALNAEICAFRGWLRMNHWWLYVCGRGVRIGFVGVVLLAWLGNVIYLGGAWLPTLAGAVLILLLSSIPSVYLSALLRWLIR